MNDKYTSIVKHYEDCLDKHGDSHLGVDWPKIEDVDKRYHVMLDLLRFDQAFAPDVSLLDFGCGAAHLLAYMQKHGLDQIDYSGLDLSSKFVALCQQKYPTHRFYCLDILQPNIALPTFDYVVMNGVFTEKRELSQDEMWEYLKKMLLTLFPMVKRGLAFNVMSKNVQWERDDLFHLSHDLLTDFITKELSRDYMIRADYQLFEYTTYIYKR
jgi:SAM-dependent methyltransferase